MKKNVFEMVVALVNGKEVADMETLRAEINAEWERTNAKRMANKNIYDTAKEIAFSILTTDTPMTVKEVFSASDEWPDGFTANKVQYAFLHYWNDEIIKHDNGKSAYTYTRK